MLKKLNKELVDKLKLIYSKDELKIIDAGLNIESRKPSFRINNLKANTENTLKSLKEAGLEIKKYEFLENCYILEKGKEKDLWDTGAFKAGYIYMQSISSQIPANIMDLKEGNKILDTTAAPGSKTSQIASILNNTGEIVAIDNNAIRIDKLNFTLKRQGVKNTLVFKNDARNISKALKEEDKVNSEGREGTLGYMEGGYFDNILFDAPCSAEGRMNLTREKSYAFWNSNIPKRNYKLQKQILEDILPLLKSGGELVYSTCTMSPEENEAIVHFLLCNYPELQLSKIDLDIPNTKNGILEYGKSRYKKEIILTKRILPSEETEGFFIAKFIKG